MKYRAFKLVRPVYEIHTYKLTNSYVSFNKLARLILVKGLYYFF